MRVAQHGSFTHAARECGLSQPGLSRQMRQLERDLGAPLFRRRRDGVLLTPAGERFRAFAEEVLAAHRRLLDDLRERANDLAGELRIIASTTPAEFLAPPLVSVFVARHPDVRASVVTADSEAVVERLLEEMWDLGFVGAYLPRPGLRFTPIADDEVVLAVPANHPFAGRATIALADLAGQRIVAREDGSGTILSVRRALTQRGLTLPPHHVSMTLSTTQAVVSAVRAGYGIGFVTSLALQDQPVDRVCAVRLDGLALRRPLYLVHRELQHLSPLARAFVALTLEEAARRPADA